MNLQLLENRRRALRAQCDEIPAHVADLESRRRAKEDLAGACRGRIEAGRKDRRSLEGEIELVKARISKYRDQLMAVKTNKEYSALLHEIEGANGSIRGVEDRVLDAMEREEEAGKELEVVERDLRELQTELDAEKARASEAVAVLEAELVGVDAEREELRAAMDKELLAHFDRVFGVRGGVAVVGIHGESCEGCRVRIRPQVLSEIRRHAVIHVCDNCKRIIYVDAPLSHPPAPVEDGASSDAVEGSS